MNLADVSIVAFALLNGGRTLAYFPQMVRIYRDPNGASAVSLLTWALFAAANAATVGYALTVSEDRIVAFIFALNMSGCLAIVGMTALKRIDAAHRRLASFWPRGDLFTAAVSREFGPPARRPITERDIATT